MPGRNLFPGEINRREQERERGEQLAKAEEEERVKKEAEERLRSMRSKIAQAKGKHSQGEADENVDIFSTGDSSLRSSLSHDAENSAIMNFGMNTAKRMFGTNGSNASSVRQYRKGFKPPPPPGRPKQKPGAPPSVKQPPTGGDQRPPADILNSRRGKEQKAEEMLNNGVYAGRVIAVL